MTSLKTISGIIIVLAVINAIGAVLTAMILAPIPGMEAAMFTAIIAVLASTALTLLVIGIGLWNLSGDIDANITYTNETISGLRKRIEALENK